MSGDGRRLALVESPAQLLNVLELEVREPQPEPAKIVVLAPAGEPTRTQLRAMTSLARQQGHEVAWYEPRLGGASVARSVRAMAADLRGVDRLVVGDLFSGVIGVIISVCRPTEVTIVDDGTATLEFARQWAAGEPLTRWHRRNRSARPPVGSSSAVWFGARSRTPCAADSPRRPAPCGSSP